MKKEIKTKKCSRCKCIEEIEKFTKDKHTKSGFSAYCVKCTSKRKFVSYRKSHIIKAKEVLPDDKKRCSKCKEIRLKKHFGYDKSRVDGLKCYCKECRKKEHDTDKRRMYIKEWTNKYNRKNPHKMAWRNLLKHSLERLGKPKEDKTINLLGYSALLLKKHIEFLFTTGMSWNNYGKWHIDHIIPVSKFDKNTSPKIVNALSNLQPLWAITREIDGVIYEGNINKGSR